MDCNDLNLSATPQAIHSSLRPSDSHFPIAITGTSVFTVLIIALVTPCLAAWHTCNNMRTSSSSCAQGIIKLSPGTGVACGQTRGGRSNRFFHHENQAFPPSIIDNELLCFGKKSQFAPMHREKPDCSLKPVMGLMVLLLFTCLILVRAKLLLTMLKLSFYYMFIFSFKMLINHLENRIGK